MMQWYMYFFYQLAVDGAFGSYSEASGGRLASLAYTPRRSPRSPPARNRKKNRKNISEKKILLKKKSKAENF